MRHMLRRLRTLNRTANQRAGTFLLIGIAGVLAYNWHAWQRDRTLASRLRNERAPLPRLPRTAMISVLVAAWNESEHIDAHIQSFQALGYPDIELILCAGGADDTLRRAERYAGERVIVLEQRAGEGKQRALARCFERASGELIYLTDADCLYNDEALVWLLDALIQEGEQAATGTSRPMARQLEMVLPGYIWAAETCSSARYPHHVEGLLGRNTLLTASAIERSGGLDFVAPTGTDYHLARRLIASGINIRFVGSSVIESKYPETLRSYRHKQSRWMRNLLLYGGQYNAYHQVAPIVRSSGVGFAMVIMPLMALCGMIWVLPFWIALLVHSLLSKVRYTAFTACVHQWQVSTMYKLSLLPLTLVEFVIWITPVFDSIRSKKRAHW